MSSEHAFFACRRELSGIVGDLSAALKRVERCAGCCGPQGCVPRRPGCRRFNGQVPATHP